MWPLSPVAMIPVALAGIAVGAEPFTAEGITPSAGAASTARGDPERDGGDADRGERGGEDHGEDGAQVDRHLSSDARRSSLRSVLRLGLQSFDQNPRNVLGCKPARAARVAAASRRSLA